MPLLLRDEAKEKTLLRLLVVHASGMPDAKKSAHIRQQLIGETDYSLPKSSNGWPFPELFQDLTLPSSTPFIGEIKLAPLEDILSQFAEATDIILAFLSMPKAAMMFPSKIGIS